jgi:hypothetical protein
MALPDLLPGPTNSPNACEPGPIWQLTYVMGDIRPYRMKNESPSGGSGSHALLAFRRDIAPRGTG